MKNDNLKRVKGILSAKLGTEVPKFLNSGLLTYAKENFITDTNFQFWCLLNNLPPSQENYIRYLRESSNTGNQITSDEDIITKKSDFTVEVNPNLGLNKNSVMSVTTEQPNVTLAIPGEIPVTPTTSVEKAAENIVQELLVMADLQVQSAAFKLLNGIGIPTADPLPKSLNDTDKDKIQANIKQRQERADELKRLQVTALQEKKSQQLLLVTQGVSGALNGLGDIFQTYNSANNSNATNTINTGVDMGANLISNLGDKIGGKAGAVMGAVGQVIGMTDSTGQIIRGITGGTDLMTAADKFFDSGIGTVLGGFVNQIWSEKSDAFATDVEALETVGSSYGGTAADITEAAQKADKKYGLFSSSARRKANEAAKKVAATQNIMSNVADTAHDQRLAVLSMGEQAGLAYSMMTDGGYNQKYTYAAKQGGILEWEPDIRLEWEPQVELNWELPTFKEGGNIDIIEELEWIPAFKNTEQYPEEYLKFKASLPDNQKNTPESEYDTYLGWKLYGKPKNFEEAEKLGMYVWDNSDNSWHGNTIAWDETTGIGYFLKSKHHSTIGYELDWFNKGVVTEEGGKQREMTPEERKEWEEFKSNYELVDDGEFYKYIPKNKQGGSLGGSDAPEIEETTQKNVIPEGALHKNKHHMEHAEGLTKKGIPVVDEDGEQQAEIEHSEIIFTLEVTKKLEEYYEIFYSEESTNKEKEQAALDAGKLLVYQILENTEDRTGLIESCKKGGSLTLKKSTDDLIEEVLEWMPTVVIVETEEEPRKESKKEESEVPKKDTKEEIKEMIKEVLIELLVK